MAGSRDDGTFADDKAHHGGRKVGRDRWDYLATPSPQTPQWWDLSSKTLKPKRFNEDNKEHLPWVGWVGQKY